jgi:hypothetical protein
MATILAENVEINIIDGSWRLTATGEEALSSLPVFEVTRGSGVLEYTPQFGEAHRLPGTVLSIEYVRAVVIGYEDKNQRWLLGLHIARREEDKARWLEIVRWPAGENNLYAAAAQHAGRELAEFIGCPLKIFGAKKLPQAPTDQASRSGVTGPLVPHKREDLSPQRVKLYAQSVKLPIQYPGIWLGQGRSGVTLRLAKEATSTKAGGVAPSFNQCVIDPEQGAIRMIPPTGLLGAFLSGQQARVLKTGDVRNVELRYIITRQHLHQKQDKELVTEITFTTYSWGVYLTLPDESLLLAQTSHATSSELSRKRATVGDKFSVDSKAGIEYLRQHQADQEAYENAETFARTVAVVIASTLGVQLVKTQVDENMT